MYDFQNTVLLSARPTKGTLILRNVALLLVALTLLGCIWINMFSFAPLFIAAMAFWWWGTFRTGLEYEYTYFDGDLDFDKIRAKSKRKHILSIHMDNVTSIVPVNDRPVPLQHPPEFRDEDCGCQQPQAGPEGV